MIRLSELIGQRAVSLRSAEHTGMVKGIVVEGNRIVAVGLTDFVVSSSGVRSFEGDVLTYDDQGRDHSLDQRGDAGPSVIDPRGSLVLDAHGDGLGQIDDLLISADGAIETIALTDGQTLSGSRLRAIGTFAAVLTDELPPPTGPPVASR